MIQSSAADSDLRKCRSPSMTSRSNRAPDFASEVRTSTRSVAPATSSSRLSAIRGADCGAVSVATSGLHLGQQRGRPAAAAEHSVPADPVAVHGDQVHLVRGVRHPALDPAQVELDGLAAGDRAPDRGLDGGRSAVPTGQLGRDRLGAVALEPPVRDRGVERASSVQTSVVMPAPSLISARNVSTGWWVLVMAAPSYPGGCSDLATPAQLRGAASRRGSAASPHSARAPRRRPPPAPRGR